MNCDQAFEVMTSSRGAHDRELHDHMGHCPRCREMHQTLEPALDLLRADAILSSSWDAASPEYDGVEIATRAARRLSAVDVPSHHRQTSLWGYFAAIVLGAGLVWTTFMMNPVALNMPQIHQGESTCLFREKPRTAGVTGQQMTQSCLACHAVTSSR